MRQIVLLSFAVFLCLAAAAAAQEPQAGFWKAPLWLTSQAFGLEKDCSVGLLFREPAFRSTALPRGGSATFRLAAMAARGDGLSLSIEAESGGIPVERIGLELRWHHSAGIVSVDSITLADPSGSKRRTLRYDEAVKDDEEYDTYTDTLVSLYTALFDAVAVRQRLETKK